MSSRLRTIRYTGLALVATLLLCTSCARYPQDPRRTLEQALAGGTLRVGVLAHSPWVVGEPPGSPGGLEGALMAAFAEELGVAIEWRWASEQALMEALMRYELDVVIGGITEDNAWQQHVAFTLPYYTSHAIVGVPPSHPIITDLDGVIVAVQPNSELSAPLQDQGATVVVQDPLAAAQGPVAAEEWAIRGMGFLPTPIQLKRDSHVMALPQGENALLLQLEDFLLQQSNETQMADRLWEAASQ
jgi:ABC-type amino acid transport substrate-binding protein